jgi:hypothetical protein
MQTFSAITHDNVPFSYYKDSKGQVQATIDSLNPDGWTSTKDGMTLASRKLSEAITTNKFPGYKYYLILLTDGVPEIPQYPDKPPRQCEITVPDPLEPGGKRCFSVDQDPRLPPPGIASSIKSLGVEIYSIGIFSQTSSDKAVEPNLVKLLQDVATPPITGANSHYYTSINANNLDIILKNIVASICDTPLGNPQ